MISSGCLAAFVKGELIITEHIDILVTQTEYHLPSLSDFLQKKFNWIKTFLQTPPSQTCHRD